MLLLHGRGADESDLLPLVPELDGRLFVVSARAPFDLPWGGYMWYDMPPGTAGEPDEATLQESLSLLTAFTAEILEAYPIDPARLYVAGFSQGAAMSAALVLTEPGRFAGALLFSGYLPLGANLPLKSEEAAGLAIFQAHGAFDETIPVSLARRTRHYLEQTSIDLTYREYPIAHSIAPEELANASAWLSPRLNRPDAQTRLTTND